MNLAFDYFINRLAWIHFMSWIFLVVGCIVLLMMIGNETEKYNKPKATKLITILLIGVAICTSLIILLPNFNEAESIIMQNNHATTQQSYRSKE